jgi:hypothetical protein
MKNTVFDSCNSCYLWSLLPASKVYQSRRRHERTLPRRPRRKQSHQSRLRFILCYLCYLLFHPFFPPRREAKYFSSPNTRVFQPSPTQTCQWPKMLVEISQPFCSINRQRALVPYAVGAPTRRRSIFGNLMQPFVPIEAWIRGRIVDALVRPAALPVRATQFDRMRGRTATQTSIVDLAEAPLE